MQDKGQGEQQGLEVLGRHGASGPSDQSSLRCSLAHCSVDVSWKDSNKVFSFAVSVF